MDFRTVAKVAVVGGIGYVAYRVWQDGVTSDVPGGGTITGSGDPIVTSDGSVTIDPTSDYLSKLSLAEDPSQDPYAKNPYSSASGLFQFTQATWTGLGGQWGNNPALAFGGLTPSVDEQTAMAAKLTAANSSVLDNIGQDINNITLYAAHIFGPQTAANVLSQDPSTPLASVVGASTVAKNPALGSTVASFISYLQKKVG